MDAVFIDPTSLKGNFGGICQLMELFIAYSYLLYLGCNMISDGAELLMLTPYSKLVGSCILPVLGAVPDGAIVLFSGIGSDAQTSLDVGVGALAGSTVMLITIPWALAIYGGRVNLDAEGRPKYSVPKGTPRLTEGNTWDSGVTVGPEGSRVVRVMAYWMAATAVPYALVEMGALIAENADGGILNQQTIDDDKAKELSLGESPWALVGLLMSFFFFCAYLKRGAARLLDPRRAYVRRSSVEDPSSHRRARSTNARSRRPRRRYQYDQAYGAGSAKIEERQRQATVNVVSGGVGLVAAISPILAMEEASGPDSAQPLVKAGGSMLEKVLKPFFSKYDLDGSGDLDTAELGRVFEDLNEPKSAEELKALFDKYDSDKSGTITFNEFCMGMKEYVGSKPKSLSLKPKKATAPVGEETKEGEAEDDEEEEVPDEFAEDKFKTVEEQQAAIKSSAIKQCAIGTLVVLIFSDPVTDVLTEFGARTGIDAFYVGFVVAPLITNGSELLASYTFALKKTQKSMTIAYEQLLGAAVMNNTYCLFIFLVLIYSQGLYWNYTAEVIAILGAELAIYVIATQMPVHTVKTAIAVLSIYPATILLVWCLENFAGIS